jgi:DNA/RNA-binding protein KIN17
MPRAEVGSTKYLNNKLKSKGKDISSLGDPLSANIPYTGLQKLRWFCQVCERQMRDENGFKCHVQSESHVRAMLLVGENPKNFIENFSRQFLRDFLLLLRTSHGEKKVGLNSFYQEFIANKVRCYVNREKFSWLKLIHRNTSIERD